MTVYEVGMYKKKYDDLINKIDKINKSNIPIIWDTRDLSL